MYLGTILQAICAADAAEQEQSEATKTTILKLYELRFAFLRDKWGPRA
jgi:hypothetical protein